MPRGLEISRFTSTTQTLTGSPDNILPTMGPLKLRRVGFHCTTGVSATNCVVTAYRVDGTTETSMGTFTIPNGTAAGSGVYEDFDQPLDVPAGTRVKLRVTTPPDTAGAGLFWTEVWFRSLSQAELAAMTKVTS